MLTFSSSRARVHAGLRDAAVPSDPCAAIPPPPPALPTRVPILPFVWWNYADWLKLEMDARKPGAKTNPEKNFVLDFAIHKPYPKLKVCFNQLLWTLLYGPEDGSTKGYRPWDLATPAKGPYIDDSGRYWVDGKWQTMPTSPLAVGAFMSKAMSAKAPPLTVGCVPVNNYDWKVPMKYLHGGSDASSFAVPDAAPFVPRARCGTGAVICNIPTVQMKDLWPTSGQVGKWAAAGLRRHKALRGVLKAFGYPETESKNLAKMLIGRQALYAQLMFRGTGQPMWEVKPPFPIDRDNWQWLLNGKWLSETRFELKLSRWRVDEGVFEQAWEWAVNAVEWLADKACDLLTNEDLQAVRNMAGSVPDPNTQTAMAAWSVAAAACGRSIPLTPTATCPTPEMKQEQPAPSFWDQYQTPITIGAVALAAVVGVKIWRDRSSAPKLKP